MNVPFFKEIRRAYGFDEVAISPGQVTVNPDMTSTQMTIGELVLDIPILASSMDAVVSPAFASLMHRKGGLGVLNLEGIYTRYDDPHTVLEEIASAPQSEVTTLLQRVYSEPVKENLVGSCVESVKRTGATCAVAVTPQNTKRTSGAAVEAGADVLVVQSTVTTARHISRSYTGLIFSDLTKQLDVPVVVGNCVGYATALELMETGISGLLVGVGPGAACTTREVVGVGVPQVTATLDCAAAREEHLKRTGKHVTIITDGGIRTGGDLCKALVAGADGVMLGTPLAQAREAPGGGFNWGMANPHPELPRGTRINVGTKGTLKEILHGPTSVTDGTQNLVGALKVALGMCGAMNIRELQQAEMIIAPSIKTEGKIFQLARN
jgi:IMP dehydrogenase